VCVCDGSAPIAFFLFRHSSGVIWRRFNSARKKRKKNQFYDTLKDMKKIELLVPVQKEKREKVLRSHTRCVLFPLWWCLRVYHRPLYAAQHTLMFMLFGCFGCCFSFPLPLVSNDDDDSGGGR
jgi:hypothetical protein